MTPQAEAYVIHNGTIILEVNDAFLELFRCDEHAILDRRIEDIISEPDLRALAVLRGKYIMQNKDDRDYSQEYEFLRFDGSRFWGVALSTRMDYDRYKTVIKWEYDRD